MKRWSRTPARRLVPIDAAPRVVVVGHCAAGKSSLVEQLRHDGIDAVTAAQEHSAVPELWKHSGAEVLVFLDVDLETVRKRRGSDWSEAIYSAQETRLIAARRSADLIIDTAKSPLDEVADRTRRYVEWWRQLVRSPLELAE
jgi:chloramphenicol 3-O-phosphotransferase